MTRIGSLYFVTLLYAVVRYVVFAPQNLDNLPVLILNKGISMAAALSFTAAFWRQWRTANAVGADPPSPWFRAGLFGVVAHVPMSLAILRPGYFREFFAGERLSFNGEAVILFGALTAGGMYLLSRREWPAHLRWWLSMAAMLTLFAHTLAMGIARGFNMTRSHAYLPPMWLLSLIGIALGVGALLLSRPRIGTVQAESGVA